MADLEAVYRCVVALPRLGELADVVERFYAFCAEVPGLLADRKRIDWLQSRGSVMAGDLWASDQRALMWDAANVAGPSELRKAIDTVAALDDDQGETTHEH